MIQSHMIPSAGVFRRLPCRIEDEVGAALAARTGGAVDPVPSRDSREAAKGEHKAMSEFSENTRARPRLYHTPSSYYSMIARLALTEGGIDYEPIFVDIHLRMSQQQPGYVRLNPNMTVPTLVLADRILDQSRDIAEYAMGVRDAAADEQIKTWLDLLYSFSVEDLTIGGALARSSMARIMVPRMLSRARHRLLALAVAYPDLAATYEARAKVFAERAHIFDPASIKRVAEQRRVEAMKIMDQMERTLADGRATLLLPIYSVVDTVFTVFLGRIEFVGLAGEIQARPALLRYWRAMQARPSFGAADIWTQFHALRFISRILGLDVL